MQVALTPNKLTPVLLAKIRDALNRRIGETDRTGAMQEAADDLEIALSTFKTRLYGRVLPDIAEFEVMCELWPGFREEVMGDRNDERASAAERELAELKASIARLQDKAENGGLRAVPKEGKV